MLKLMAILLLGILLGFFAHHLEINDTPSSDHPAPTSISDLGEKSGETFPFSTIVQETTPHKIIRFDQKNAIHLLFKQAISDAAETTRLRMNAADSPVSKARRINEASRFFEEALRSTLDSYDDFKCTHPLTLTGEEQRSGYPDLCIEHLPSGQITYLDPKLFEQKSIRSSFRSFYYEPAGENSKITADALHFLVGFSHDGQTGNWTFKNFHLIDLSSLTVTLKTEFSASNRNIYSLE